MFSHFRSRDTDGCHTIRYAIVKNPMLHGNCMALCFIEPELLIEVLHWGNWNLRIFGSCGIDVDPMTFIYQLDPYSLEIHYMCANKPPTSTLSDRQKDRSGPKLYTILYILYEIIHHTASRVVNKTNRVDFTWKGHTTSWREQTNKQY